MSADGSSLLWATYLGGGIGDGNDAVFDLALDTSGNVIMCGDTYSSDFPATPGAYDSTYNGVADAFVAKLSADGSSLVWATYLGGGNAEHCYALAYDGSGVIFVGGETQSANFPATPGAYDTSLNGLEDAFVASLSEDGSALRWGTFLGGTGSGEDEPWAFEIDTSGNPVVAGVTYAPDFPTTPGAYDPTYSGGFTDAFVSKLSADGSTLLWSTFLGGGVGDGDQATALVRDGSGNFIVAGRTLSSDFPVTSGAYDITYNGGGDAFAATLSADGTALLWSTFLGGDGDEGASKFELDSSGDLVLAGATQSANFPATPDAFDPTFNGFVDAFVARLSPDGSSLVYASFLGGGNAEGANDVALDVSGNPIVVGRADSSDFPVTAGAFDVEMNGSYEAFVAKLTLGALSPPETTITSPAAGTWYSTTAVTVSGNATDEGAGVDRVEVSCDGGSTWGLAAGTVSWTISCTALGEGPNRVVARAVDRVGWMFVHDITVNLDLTPPRVAITLPEEGSWFGSGLVTVSGTATDFGGSGFSFAAPPEVSTGCTISHTSANSPELRWDVVCGALVEGPNRIDLRFFDSVGWVSPASISLNVDLTAPLVAISVPAEGAWFSGNAVTISGTATDEGSGLDRVEVSCDSATTWHPAMGRSSWAYACMGQREGRNLVRARAFDLVGRESANKLLSVNVDLTPPTVTIVCVPSRGEVGTAVTCALEAFDDLDPSPTISWRVTRQGSVVIAGSGMRVEFTPDRVGPYVVEAVAQDRTGHLGTDSATVTASERLLVWVSLFVVLPAAVGVLMFLLARRKKRRRIAPP